MISTNIKNFRKFSGLTQKKLAKIMDVKQSYIGAIEEGRTSPRVEFLKRLRTVTGISIDGLVLSKIEKFQIQDHEKLALRRRIKAKETLIEILEAESTKEKEEALMRLIKNPLNLNQ